MLGELDGCNETVTALLEMRPLPASVEADAWLSLGALAQQQSELAEAERAYVFCTVLRADCC